MNKYTKKIILLLFFAPVVLFAQNSSQKERTAGKKVTSHSPVDTLAQDTITVADTAVSDTAAVVKRDSLPIRYATDGLDAEVDYYAEDSILFDVEQKKVYLYGNAEVTYKNIHLTADYIEFDWQNNLIVAEGMEDTTGKLTGRPVFKEGEQEYRAERIVYNYRTKKGRITSLITKEDEGYIHGHVVKKNPNDELFAKDAKYTTCELEDPHYSIDISKLKIIPDKVAVSGPANLIIEDVPTPLYIPFGIFPLKRGQRSGVLAPEFANSGQLGFFLRNGGYYFAVSDYLDLALRGDIYSRGSWRINPASNYKKLYKYSGLINLSYSVIKRGDPQVVADYKEDREFNLRWRHNQDVKARPGTTFNADVNIVSKDYHSLNSYDANEFLASQFQSAITYGKQWKGYNLTANLSHSQNTKDRSVNLRLPSLTFSTPTYYPFRKKEAAGRQQWFEKINLNYQAQAVNELRITDSLLFGSDFPFLSDTALSAFQNGISHDLPIRTSAIKIFKHFNLTPSIQYNEKWYFETIRKEWDPTIRIDSIFDVNADTLERIDTTYGQMVVNEVPGFRQARFFQANLGLTTRLFGMVQFKKSKIKALRHVITPSVTFQYHPDFGDPFWGYYKEVRDENDSLLQTYSIFERNVFGGPQAGKYGGIALSLGNNIEMKVFSKKDTVNQERKVKILETLNFNTFYNMAADSLKWRPVVMNGSTTLFEKLNIRFGALLDPYVIDTNARRLDRFELTENKRLGRITQANLNIGLPTIRSQKKSLHLKEVTNEAEAYQLYMVNRNIDDYVDFTIPWEFSVDYNIHYQKNYRNELPDTISITQSINFNAGVSLTPNWKITVRSGYDFINGEFTYTDINIYRDLHCWEIKFRLVPFGQRQMYSVDLNVKAAVLQSLKLSRKKDWYDMDRDEVIPF